MLGRRGATGPEASSAPAAAEGAAAGCAAPGAKDATELTFWQKWRNYFIWGAVILVVALLALLVVWFLMSRSRDPADLSDGAMRPPYKPKGDMRSYQYKTLASGIQVYNILDPSAVTSAYSVSVLAGSFDEPTRVPGLAHFCEHMVFLGSKSYPDPAGYDNFLSQHSGNSNAYTADEATVYFSELSSSAFVAGMKRFSEFFYAPKFDKQYVEKEVHAIDSEHTKNVQDPSWRMINLMMSLANPDSPVSTFHTGDLQTLQDEPKKNGLDPVDELKSWYKDHYCPNKFRLVTYGPMPLRDQMMIAEEAFAEAPPGNKTCQGPRRSWAEPEAWPSSSLGKYLVVQGTQPQPSMMIMFPLPDVRPSFESQPLEYVRYVLGYGGPRSLSVVLRDTLGLATSIDVSGDSSSAGSLLWLELKLTPAGKAHPGLVLGTVFQFLATLRSRGVDASLLDSLKNATLLGWDWAEPASATDTVSSMADRMTRLPLDSVLTGDALIIKQDQELISKLIKKLTPTNANVALVDPGNEQGAFQSGSQQVLELPHYGTKYTISTLHEAFPGDHAKWASWLLAASSDPASALSSQQLKEAIDAAEITYDASESPIPEPPKAIKGIPAEIDTEHMHVQAEAHASGSQAEKLFGPAPAKLGAIPGHREAVKRLGKQELWYRSGWMSTSPVASLKVAMRVKKVDGTAEATAVDESRLAMWNDLFKHDLSIKLADLMAAGASFNVDVSTDGITLDFGGFPPLIPRVIDAVLAGFKSGVDVANQDGTPKGQFTRLFKQYEDGLQDFSDMPVHYALEDRNLLLAVGSSSKAETLASLREVTPQNTKHAFMELVMAKPLEVLAMGMGNIDDDYVRRTMDLFDETLGQQFDRPPHDEGKVEAVAPIVSPGVPAELRRANPRAGDGNDAVVVSIILGVSTVKKRVINHMLGSILGNVAYTELRTQQQLGYVVSAGNGAISNVQYMSTVVQGNKLKADEMEAAIEQVSYVVMPEHLRTMTDEEFQNHKAGLRSQLMQPPTGYSQEADHFWPWILKGGACLDLQDEMLKYLETSVKSKDDLVKAWDDIIHPAGGMRKKVVVKYFAGTVPEKPSKQAARELWHAHGVPQDGIRMLEGEFDKTLVFDKADSAARRALRATGGVFPPDLNCKAAPAAVALDARRGGPPPQLRERATGHASAAEALGSDWKMTTDNLNKLESQKTEDSPPETGDSLLQEASEHGRRAGRQRTAGAEAGAFLAP